MHINDKDIYNNAKAALIQMYGATASFRDGQYEAIEATFMNNRTLVVQKTGWGKSLVYFVCTKLLRDVGKGVTVVVSPLLVLMQNQIEAAKKMGLVCDVLNSTVADRRNSIIESLVKGEIDLLLVTPESLFKEDFQKALKDISIGLFVVDEAHCISDWGHDFRLDYGRLYKVLQSIPFSVPILATTATANNRVIADLKKQLGNDVHISRGPLMRESLSIQVLRLANKAERYAWILQNINHLPGSGIIYCLTQRDCDYLAEFLKQNGVSAMSYYSRNEEEENLNRDAELLFQENKIKALVATIKLGMGYDKGDIAFVVHFQQPGNIVSYYQQIGRAGRNIKRAYTFLMTGLEDKDIQDYFIETAFPTKEEASDIRGYIFENTEQGCTLGQINAAVNYKKARIDKALMFLVSEGFVVKEKSKYYVTPKPFSYDDKHYAEVTAVRKSEQNQMGQLIETKECYNRFIVNCLDDETTECCGICRNCLGYEEFSSEIEQKFLDKALEFIERLIIPIEPRKKWASTAYTNQSNIKYQNEVGVCLSRYGDVGYGALVKRDKYAKEPHFCDELVGKSAQILRPIIREKKIFAITCVPSLRSNIVQEFAERLAISCDIRFIQLIEKSPASQQKAMQNSSHQCENAYGSFKIIPNVEIPERVILVDDIVDSKWTITVCGYRLMEAGCELVFPYALADSSQKED